jgi:DNA (cytosine-5)-methyltransferase 1
VSTKRLNCKLGLGEHEELGFRARKRLLTEKYRAKASKALENNKSPLITHFKKSYKYFITLSNTFEYKLTDQRDSEFSVNVSWNNNLTISIHEKEPSSYMLPRDNFAHALSISILPISPWNITAEKFRVDIFTNNELGYTAGWKAIEYELAQNNIKADLVQLCGYYHDSPKISCRLDCLESSPFYFLRAVVNGSITRRLLYTTELANTWGISNYEVINYAQKMRILGYEIRNNNTNPQIKKEQWLIPYSFPTLSPLSVQLRKKLYL